MVVVVGREALSGFSDCGALWGGDIAVGGGEAVATGEVPDQGLSTAPGQEGLAVWAFSVAEAEADGFQD